jgi:hypothetical protein
MAMKQLTPDARPCYTSKMEKAPKRGRPKLPESDQMVRHVGLKLTADTSAMLDSILLKVREETGLPVSISAYIQRLVVLDANARGLGSKAKRKTRKETGPMRRPDEVTVTRREPAAVLTDDEVDALLKD